MTMFKCQTRLTIIWVTGSVLLLVVAWLQILFGHYGDSGREVMEWFLPTVTPTLSLVVGVWVNNVVKKTKSTAIVDNMIYRIVLVTSIVYLCFLALVFAIQPMVARPPIEILKESSLILSPLQGIACAFIGILFTQRSR